MSTFRTKPIKFQHVIDKTGEDHPRTPFIRSFGFFEQEEGQLQNQERKNRREEVLHPHLYSCAINPFVPEGQDQIAVAVGTQSVFLYQLPVNKPEVKRISHLTVRAPEGTETLQTVTWCLDPLDKGKEHKIVCGGLYGALYVINGSTLEIDRELIGHTNEITEARTSPMNPSLVVTSSKDRTVRVFHIREETCLLLFANRYGHTDSVISADWSPDARSIISGGFDQKVFIWDMETPAVANHMKRCLEKIERREPLESFVSDLESIDRLHSGEAKFDLQGITLIVHCPSDVIKDLHFDTIDCIRSIKLGGDNYILSKAAGYERGISLWRSGLMDPNGVQSPDEGINRTFVEVWSKQIKNWQYYSSKFTIDPLRRWVVTTTSDGTLNFYKLFERESDQPSLTYDLPMKQNQAHDVSFSTDGQILLCVSDSGLVIRLDRIPASYTGEPKDLYFR